MKIIKEIGRNPNVDWISILFLSIVVIACLGFLGFSLYNGVTHGTIQGTEEPAASSFKKLNEKAITSVIDDFAKKEEASAKARAGYSGSSDPSI